MAVPFLLLLLLVASGGAAGADDGAVQLPHIQLHGIEDSGSGHTSDAAPPGHGLIMSDLLLAHGCGRFGAILAATATATEIFQDHVVGGGLTVFCPNDLAVAAVQTKLSNLSADDKLAVVLYHGAAARYGRDEIAAFESVEIRTLAADSATSKTRVLAVRNDGETVWLWPSSRGSGGVARVTKVVASGDSTLAIYVVDAVLLPSEVRKRLDGGDEAAACTSYGGYLGWLHLTVPLWFALCMYGAGMVGVLTGFFLAALKMN